MISVEQMFDTNTSGCCTARWKFTLSAANLQNHYYIIHCSPMMSFMLAALLRGIGTLIS